MTTVLHLSDLHFGTESPRVLRSLNRHIHQTRPDVVAISGDLTQRARKGEFIAARRFVDNIERGGSVVVVVPGNHDIPLYNPVARLFFPFKRYRTTFGSTQVRSTCKGHVRLIMVNSVRRERQAAGFITSRHRHDVALAAGRRRPGEINVVIAHHPLGLAAVSPLNPVHNGDATTCRAWHRAGVNVILSGHVHRSFVLDATEQLIANPEDVAAPLWIINAGTAVSNRLRHSHPNSFNVLHFDPKSKNFEIERWDYLTAADTFSKHETVSASLVKHDSVVEGS